MVAHDDMLQLRAVRGRGGRSAHEPRGLRGGREKRRAFAESSAHRRRRAGGVLVARRRAERHGPRLGFTGTAGACTGIPVYRYRFPGLLVTQALQGPFTAVSKLIFSTEGSFCRIFQALQDWPAFAHSNFCTSPSSTFAVFFALLRKISMTRSFPIF